MADDRRFDSVLMTMAGQAGTIERLLRIFFSFLHRQTDLYVSYNATMTAHAKMGFPRGKAEQLILRAFHAFPFKEYPAQNQESTSGKSSLQRSSQAESSFDPNIGIKSAVKGMARPSPADTTPLSEVREESRTLSHGPKADYGASSASSGSSRAAQPVNMTSADTEEGTIRQTADNRDSSPGPSALTTKEESNDFRVRYTKNGKQIPIGNGGITPNYYWTQTLDETTVYVDIPCRSSSKDIECVIEPRRLRLAIIRDGVKDVIIDGRMPSAVSREGSLWNLIDGRSVAITLEKSKGNWWSSVIEGDPEIDTTQVDSTTKIGDYDEETQGTIRKIMFDQRQKALGLPTSDEIHTQSLLDKAKDLPGSPFLPGGALCGSKNDRDAPITCDIDNGQRQELQRRGDP